MANDERNPDIVGIGDPDGGWRAPGWLRRALLGLAVVAALALVGRELLSDGPDARRWPGGYPSPTGPAPGYPMPYDAADQLGGRYPAGTLVGTLDGRIVRVLPDGTVQRGPRIGWLYEPPPGISVDDIRAAPWWPWRTGRALALGDGWLLYVADGKLHTQRADLSGSPRTVTAASRLLPCGTSFASACVVTKNGAAAKVRPSDGRIVEPEVVPRESYADGWRPVAVLTDGVVFVRPNNHADVGFVPVWDDKLRVVARDVRFLGAGGSQIVVWDPEAAPRALTSYVVNSAVQKIVPNTVTPPTGWHFLPHPAGFVRDFSTVAITYVGRGGDHALAVVEPYGGGDPAALVPGSFGADPDAGMAWTQWTSMVVFAVSTAEGRRFAGLTDSAQPARLLPPTLPTRLYVGGLQQCPPFDGICTR